MTASRPEPQREHDYSPEDAEAGTGRAVNSFLPRTPGQWLVVTALVILTPLAALKVRQVRVLGTEAQTPPVSWLLALRNYHPFQPRYESPVLPRVSESDVRWPAATGPAAATKPDALTNPVAPRSSLALARFDYSQVLADAFSPDGTRLASGGRDGSVRLWTAATGKLLWTQHPHQRDVVALAFAPDGSALATGSFDGTCKVLDARTGKVRYTINQTPGASQALAFTPDGRQLVCGGRDTTRFTLAQGWQSPNASVSAGPHTPDWEAVRWFDASNGSQIRMLKVRGGDLDR